MELRTKAKKKQLRSPGRLLAGALLAGLVMAGCGSPPAGVDVPRGPKALAPPTMPTAGEDERPEVAHLAKLATALNTMNYLEGTISFKEFEGTKEEHGTARCSFRRSPFAARVDIEQSNRMLAAGSSVLWTGGDKVWVRRKGIPLTVPFPYDNSLVTSIRGYRFDQTDMFSMGRVLLAKGAKVKLLGRQKIEGRERLMFEVQSPASLPGVTREKIGLDADLYVPTYREVYAGTALIHRGIGKNLTINKKLEADRFDL